MWSAERANEWQVLLLMFLCWSTELNSVSGRKHACHAAILYPGPCDENLPCSNLDSMKPFRSGQLATGSELYYFVAQSATVRFDFSSACELFFLFLLSFSSSHSYLNFRLCTILHFNYLIYYTTFSDFMPCKRYWLGLYSALVTQGIKRSHRYAMYRSPYSPFKNNEWRGFIAVLKSQSAWKGKTGKSGAFIRNK